jgi:tRNA pseudouridine55 synthase
MSRDAAVAPADPEGVLVLDKPTGMTSHDVVARVRRLLGTRRVGHAGTLDPMATGVLVVLVGEATKLGPYLTADDKRYVAKVCFGRATDTLDAEGKVTATAAVPGWLVDELRAAGEGSLSGARRLAEALAAEMARTRQVPPAYSAIHVDGKRSHDLARAGEAVDLAPREVAVRAIEVVEAGAPEPPEDPWITLQVHVAKGYYVRSLGRDLGERLGVPAHLAALARTASGAFAIEDAAALDAGADALRAALIPTAAAASRALPVGRLTAEGVVRVRQGKVVSPEDFAEVPPVADASAWLGPEGRLCAIGAHLAPASAKGSGMAHGPFVIHRGFVG